jgi:hypothetical protein
MQQKTTLIFGLYTHESTSAVTLSVRTAGDIEEGGQWVGADPWGVLAQALDECRILEADGVILFCNDPHLVRQLLTGAVPAPDKSQRHWVLLGEGKGKYVDVPYGGNADHWRVLSLLTAYCTRDGWTAKLTDTLPKTEELWRQNQE